MGNKTEFYLPYFNRYQAFAKEDNYAERDRLVNMNIIK